VPEPDTPAFTRLDGAFCGLKACSLAAASRLQRLEGKPGRSRDRDWSQNQAEHEMWATIRLRFAFHMRSIQLNRILAAVLTLLSRGCAPRSGGKNGGSHALLALLSSATGPGRTRGA
jgi:hypothetical protein